MYTIYIRIGLAVHILITIWHNSGDTILMAWWNVEKCKFEILCLKISSADTLTQYGCPHALNNSSLKIQSLVECRKSLCCGQLAFKAFKEKRNNSLSKLLLFLLMPLLWLPPPLQLPVRWRTGSAGFVVGTAGRKTSTTKPQMWEGQLPGARSKKSRES